MTAFTLHFFDDRTTAAFIETCKDMRVPGTIRKTSDAPRYHVRAECPDEKRKKALVEEWGKRSVERH